QPLSEEKLLLMAAEMEGHPDNVAPAFKGGFTIIVHEGKKLRVKRLELPPSLMAVLAIPDFPVSTKKARLILPPKVELADAVYNLSHAAMLAVCLAEGDLLSFGSMMKDRLHQPYRFSLIPGAADVITAAHKAKALGCAISGSGSTMIAFHDGDKEQGAAIGQAMRKTFLAHHIQAQIMEVALDNQGAGVVG
ncbi:MAG: homoserine kinase, partial [Clostridiales bacterium]|nr:homoserine kinase [Clostridiales bacterium]